jgi:small-conductance mechanosensitive channel
LVLQYQVALETRRCDDVLARIAQAKESLVSHLGTVDAPPIWSPELWSVAAAQMGPGIREAASRWTRQLLFVVQNRGHRIALQAVLFVVLLIPLVRARGHAQVWILPDTGVAPAARMLERPASAALVLTLLVTPWFYPSYAFAVSRLATLLGIIPALRLLTPVASRAEARGLYGFSVVIAVEALRPLLSMAPELDQVLVLAEMLCSSLLLGWILLAERRPGRAQTADRPASRSRGPTIVIAILWLVFVVAFLAGAGGYMQLARLIGDAALDSTYTALAILIGVWLLLVLFAYSLWARPLGVLESVRQNRAVLERRAGRTLRALGGLAWVLISLRPLAVFDAPAGVVRAVLSAGVAWGTVRITVGDVLLFGVTIWAAFTLAAIVRAVLETDIFPRIRLAHGVPLALASLSRYAILLAGFILGLAALGVDLTKVTILVGAFGVGIGFGLQTLAGNFAAWLILLFERPIREGDVVQVGDVQGEVRHIGVRASTVRTGRGADVFVPNAQLLTEKITNWTYLDRTLRMDLPVTVAFDSDPRRVIEVLRRVAAAHPDVQREPAPAAFCLGLGPNGLTFEVRMWTSHFERADSIRSQVAEAVCAALIEEKIAFPQREVWLRMVGDPAGGVLRPPSST